jgi:hypothetical protein
LDLFVDFLEFISLQSYSLSLSKKGMNMFLSILLSTIQFAPAQTEPTHRELQLENDSVRVWKTTIVPSNPLKMHRHDAPRVVIGLKGGTLKKITDAGQVSDLTFETGKSVWLDVDPPGELHADINNGSEPIEVIIVELKN